MRIWFNEGTCVNSWLPVLCVRRGFFYFSQRISWARRVHLIFGEAATPKARGLSCNGRNLFSGERW